MRVRPLFVGLVSPLAAGAVVAALVAAGPASARIRVNEWKAVPAAKVSGRASLAGVAAVSLRRSKPGFGYAACEYSLIRPLRIFLRRIRAVARSTTGVGALSVALGGRWWRPWCGRWSL
jgi:hypothetical protein